MSLTSGMAFFLGLVMFPVGVISLMVMFSAIPTYRTSKQASRAGFTGWSSALDWPNKKKSWIFARWGKVWRDGTPSETWSEEFYAHLCGTRLICKKQHDEKFVAGAYGLTWRGNYFFSGWCWNKKK